MTEQGSKAAASNPLAILQEVSTLISLFQQVDMDKLADQATAVGADFKAIFADVEKAGADLAALLNEAHSQISTVKKLAASHQVE